MKTTADRLLTPYDEARHQLGDIGRTKFYQLIEHGQLIKATIGRRGFIVTESLNLFVKSLTEGAAESPIDNLDTAKLLQGATESVRTKVFPAEQDSEPHKPPRRRRTNGRRTAAKPAQVAP